MLAELIHSRGSFVGVDRAEAGMFADVAPSGTVFADLLASLQIST